MTDHGWLLDAAAEANRLIETCHERRACPRCGAPIGEVCRGLPKGWRPPLGNGRKLAHPHLQRFEQEVRKR